MCESCTQYSIHPSECIHHRIHSLQPEERGLSSRPAAQCCWPCRYFNLYEKRVSDLRTKLWSIKNACRLFRLYLRHPYRLYDTDQFDSFNHQHTCLLARISPTHFGSLCPMAERGRFIAGDFDECENCRYFGLIHYGIDSETGDKRIEVTMGQN